MRLAESLAMSNSYPSDGNFNPHLTIIKDSYSFAWARIAFLSDIFNPPESCMHHMIMKAFDHELHGNI